MTGDGITLDGEGQLPGRFRTATGDGTTPTDPTATGQQPPPPPSREQAQGQQRGLIQAIMAGDHEAVEQSLSFFERLAERFGMGDLFNTIKGFIDSIMGAGQPVSNEDAGRVNTMTGDLIDQTLPAAETAPAPTTR